MGGGGGTPHKRKPTEIGKRGEAEGQDVIVRRAVGGRCSIRTFFAEPAGQGRVRILPQPKLKILILGFPELLKGNS